MSARGGSAGPSDRATALGQLVTSRRWQLAVAESLTGGQLSATIARGVDARRWFKGGVVAYQRAVKQQLLGVFDGPLVSSRCACEMAVGAAILLGADVGLVITASEVPNRTKATRLERCGSLSELLWASFGPVSHPRRHARRDLRCELRPGGRIRIGTLSECPPQQKGRRPSVTGFET